MYILSKYCVELVQVMRLFPLLFIILNWFKFKLCANYGKLTLPKIPNFRYFLKSKKTRRYCILDLMNLMQRAWILLVALRVWCYLMIEPYCPIKWLRSHRPTDRQPFAIFCAANWNCIGRVLMTNK